MGRRQFLTAATSVVAVAGAVGVAVPFVGSWNPSAKAKAAGAPVKFDVSKMEPGQLVRVEWRGQPVFVIRRTKEQIDDLSLLDDMLKDPNSLVSSQPDYVDSSNRAVKDEFLVLVGLCTHLGCSPSILKSWMCQLQILNGRVDFFVRVMVQNLIWLVGFTKVSQLQKIWLFPL